MTFCDGTYMGPGGSFDISSGEPIVIKTANASGTNSLTVGATSVDVNIGVGVSGSLVKFGTGSINIESDYGTVGAPVLALIDTGSGNSAYIEFGINSLSIGTNTGNISIYAPASNITVQVSAGQYNFGNVLSYNVADTMLVDANKAEQVPTNQIAVAQFFPRETILPVHHPIDNTNPPLAEFKQTSSFAWRYSGTGVGSSYCRADRVEVIFDICIIGLLGDTIQWGIKLVDPASAEYPSVGAFDSYDTVTPATGLEYTTVGNRTNPSGKENHTASIRCYFDGVNAIADGNSVYFNIFAISRNAGTFTVDDGWYSFRIRPVTRIP